MTTAADASVLYSPSSQSVPLTATVRSTDNLNPAVDEGTVTFTVRLRSKPGGAFKPVGSPVTSATVSAGFASVSYVLPAGLAAGPPGGYTIDAAYNGTANFLASHHDECIVAVYPMGSTTTSFSNSSPITIPESQDHQGPTEVRGSAPFPSQIIVSGKAGTITNLAVTLHGLSHRYPGDMDMLLVGPAGQSTVIFGVAGGGHTISNVTVTLSDLGAFPLRGTHRRRRYR